MVLLHKSYICKFNNLTNVSQKKGQKQIKKHKHYGLHYKANQS